MRLSRLYWTAIIFALPFVCQHAFASDKSANNSTKDVHWDSYMKALEVHMKAYWKQPESYTSSHTVAVWKIHKDGTVSDVKISTHGTNDADDNAVIKAIKAASPFDPLPKGASGACEIEFSFDSCKPKPLGLTVAQALKQFGPDAKKRILPCFQRAQVAYPPKNTTWICLKDEGLVLVFAKGEDGKVKQVTSYPIVASSGLPGPKLKEGDLQIPEGFYKTTNLDASTHLCLWVNYPNRKDQANARLDHRTKLGGNIQVHGGVSSTGCVVLDNKDMAELFVLAHDSGCQNIDLIIAPCNLIVKNPEVDFTRQPKWLPKLYNDLKKALAGFPIATTPQPSAR